MKLSVSTITYNHEKFIAQAIEGVLMQEVDFDYEFVIGEDCSPDRTYEIAAEYQRRFPDRIRLLRPEKNLGMNRNFLHTLKQCRGQYIALLDGDDYWTSPHKLQRQVEYLDSHPECAITYHNVLDSYTDGSQPDAPRLQDQPRVSTLEDLLSKGDFLPTSSVVFRNGLIDGFPEWFCDLPFGDWTLMILNARHGNIAYFDEVMGVYRHHPGGVLCGGRLEDFWQGAIELFHHLEGLLGKDLTRLMHPLISERYRLLASHAEIRGETDRARSLALKRLSLCPFDSQGEQPLKHLMRLYTPGIYRIAKSMARAVAGQAARL